MEKIKTDYNEEFEKFSKPLSSSFNKLFILKVKVMSPYIHTTLTLYYANVKS